MKANAVTLPTQYQQYIHVSKYSRFNYDIGRRETWMETVDRYVSYMHNHLNNKLKADVPAKKFELVRDSILHLRTMPSMRMMMTAGPALERNNIAAFNCSYAAVSSLSVFKDALLILMHGTGFGFSVERQFISRLPTVPRIVDVNDTFVVDDSKEGWADALYYVLTSLYDGKCPKWDVSNVRPKGAVLKTFGGRASGPEPLDSLLRFVVSTVKAAQGRKLTSIECHDIMCKIGEVVVVGGVRRSAMISLSNLSDDRMRHAKSGEWWKVAPHRALANNSWCATETPEVGVFMSEWISLYESKSGERGIFSRQASIRQAAKNGRRVVGHDGQGSAVYCVETDNPNVSYLDFGTNPCSEIILRHKQFCNLTEIVVREDDTEKTLAEKAKVASILGTWQSTLTNFPGLDEEWVKNTEEERLLGVSMTGILDNVLTANPSPEMLQRLRKVAVETNRAEAKAVGINQSAAVTCVKPSGTVSQLTDSASGIHARHAPHYIRRVRGAINDPLTQFLIDSGVPNERCVINPNDTVVFSFPQKAPPNAICRSDKTALEQLELWKLYQEHWCEHKPSVTISVKENEWPEVGAWVWNNIDSISGVSFLPHSEHTYRQAPYEDCTEEEYNALVAAMPALDWDDLSYYDNGADNTVGAQTLACTAGACEVN